MPAVPIEAVRAIDNAYAESDRAKAETLIADDFRFTSPLDNRLDRRTYFERCWPNNENIKGFDIIHMVSDDQQGFVTYEARSAYRRFRNTEIITVRGEKIIAVKVYSGWNPPHEAVPGGFVEQT
jgi:hypothetical protein